MQDKNRCLLITLSGERPISWNKLYSGQHWNYRTKEARRVHMLVRSEIDPNREPFDKPVDITVRVYFSNNRRLDACNVPAKIYIDGLKPFVIKDDDYRYVKSVTTKPLLDRKNPRVEIEIKE